MNPLKLIGRYFQRRREEQIKSAAKHDAHQQWLAYMRRRKVIMPQPRPDDRSILAMHDRIMARQR